MKLSDPERLILSMLADISTHLKINNGIDGKFVQNALCDGNEWSLYWKYTGLFHESRETPAAVKEVLDILQMWEGLEDSYAALPAAEQSQIKADSNRYVSQPVFTGFDGNGESEYIGIARTLVEELDRFSIFKGREFNSHLPGSLSGYRRMLSVFNHVPLLEQRSMSVPTIIEILKRGHPQNVAARAGN